MPMSKTFKQRLFPALPEIVEEFGTPFHIVDMAGVLQTGRWMNRAFAETPYRQFFAVKALPDPHVMQMLYQELGSGFDCSSVPELVLARGVGARGADIMFTSNNTSADEFRSAILDGGCRLNLDDISLVQDVPDPFPEEICFRINPGKQRTGNSIIGDPVKSKYGIMPSQIVPAYREARERGAMKFGMHTMLCSNELRAGYMVDTVKMLLEFCAWHRVRVHQHGWRVRYSVPPRTKASRSRVDGYAHRALA
jgi:diaminopimelate decarboxylase